MTLYEGGRLEPLRIQYRDYVEWLNSDEEQENINKQGEFWLTLYQNEPPVLRLNTDFIRPAVQDFRGGTVICPLGIKETRSLYHFALNQGTTIYTLLLAAFNVLLAKLSGQEDIAVGTPLAGRRHADLQQIIGMFINTLALRNFPRGEKRFEEFFSEVKSSTLEAFENQEYPFEELVDQVCQNRDVSRNPLFDVMFALQNMEQVKIDSTKRTDDGDIFPRHRKRSR